MTTMEEQLNRIETILRVIMEAQRPQVTFAEIQQRLGHESKSTTLRWIKAHKLTRVDARAYRFIDFINAATREHGKLPPKAQTPDPSRYIAPRWYKHMNGSGI